MNTTTADRVIQQATLDAQGFQEEFPGQSLSGDWDSESWQMACSELQLTDDEQDAISSLYLSTLSIAISAAL